MINQINHLYWDQILHLCKPETIQSACSKLKAEYNSAALNEWLTIAGREREAKKTPKEQLLLRMVGPHASGQ
jgi:hypothetical protein